MYRLCLLMCPFRISAEEIIYLFRFRLYMFV